MNEDLKFVEGSAEEFLKTLNVDPYAKEGERNLIEEFRVLLIEELARVGKEDKIHLFDNDSNILGMSKLNVDVQRYKINMFLNSQYATLGALGSQHVQYLSRDNNLEEWMEINKIYHVKKLVENDLPVCFTDYLEEN